LYLAKIPSGVFFSPKRKEEKEDGLFWDKTNEGVLKEKKQRLQRASFSLFSRIKDFIN